MKLNDKRYKEAIKDICEKCDMILDQCDTTSSKECDVTSSEKCDTTSFGKCDMTSSEECDTTSFGKCDMTLVLCQYFGHKKSNFFMLHF